LTVLTLEPAAGAAMLTSESCAPANQAADPGETVTFDFALRNLGSGNMSNLVATLQPTGSVTNPSSPQTYGALTGGGSAVTRPFTFTAVGACGATLTATLQLQDGALNLGTVSFPLLLGVARTSLSENFDGVTAPALPNGWTTSVAAGTAPAWVTSTLTSDTQPNNAFATDPNFASDVRLDSPGIAIMTAAAQLSFRHNYSTETSFDGGVLEIAIGSGSFTDIIAAGGSFVEGGYTQTLTGSNPIAGRRAWSGTSNGYVTARVNLPANAAGQSIRLRWRMTTDGSRGGTGWRVDTITLSEPMCVNCSQPPCHTVSSLNPTSGPAGASVVITGQNLTGVTTVRFTGGAVANFTINSPTQLTAIVPAGATSGTLTISKAGCPDAQTAAFTVTQTTNPQPALTSLEPNSRAAGSAGFTLTLNGTGFIPASSVSWNTTERLTAYLDPTRLMIDVPASDLTTAGTATLTVTNPAPGGGVSNALTFTITSSANPAPTLSSLNPNPVATSGQPLMLTVNGANFVNGAVVRVNGADRSTTFVSATRLTATLSAADIANPGTARITVFNPPPGGGASNEMTLTILRALASVSAASFLGNALAPESILAAFGTGLASATQVATTTPLPTTLAGVTLRVRDGNGAERLAPLFFVAPTQINYLLPLGTANGAASVTVSNGDSVVALGTINVAALAPGLFSANADGQGVAAGVALRVKADGSQSFEPLAEFNQAQNRFVPRPIDLGPATDQVFLILFGTAIRGRSNLAAVTCTIGGESVPLTYAGAQGDLVGLDQVNAGALPRSLAMRGEVDLVLTADGRTANTVRVSFR
jgi:uncharacterized protein (TIGR03437 family)